MSEAAKFARKLVKEKVNGIEVGMMPLGTSDLEIMEGMDKKPQKEQTKVVKELIKRSIPESTDEEIDAISLGDLLALQEAIMRVNKLDKGSDKKEFLDKIRKKQNLPK